MGFQIEDENEWYDLNSCQKIIKYTCDMLRKVIRSVYMIAFEGLRDPSKREIETTSG